MKRRVLLLCLYAAISALGQSKTNDHLFPIREGRKFGFINRSGALVVAPLYDAVGEPSENRVRVTAGNLSGYIDLSGKLIIETKYDGAEDFHASRAIVRQDTKYSIIDPSGKLIGEIPYRV